MSGLTYNKIAAIRACEENSILTLDEVRALEGFLPATEADRAALRAILQRIAVPYTR